jgi:hypothetical protein
VRRGSNTSGAAARAALICAAVALIAGGLTAPATAATQRPVAAYSFDEGSGTTVKDSAGQHNGTITGATWTSVGKYGSALSFDGTDDVVKAADAADLDLTGSFTLEAWVRADEALVAGPVVTKAENPGSGTTGYQLSAHSQSLKKPTGLLANAGVTTVLVGPTALTKETWTHLALSYDGAKLRLYVNGALAETKSAAAAGANAASLEIGASAFFNSYFKGLIDEVRVYDEALSEAQIQVDRDTAVGLDEIPVAAYSFDQSSGTVATDSAGDHDGTLEGGVAWTTSGKYGAALSFGLPAERPLADLEKADRLRRQRRRHHPAARPQRRAEKSLEALGAHLRRRQPAPL